VSKELAQGDTCLEDGGGVARDLGEILPCGRYVLRKAAIEAPKALDEAHVGRGQMEASRIVLQQRRPDLAPSDQVSQAVVHLSQGGRDGGVLVSHKRQQVTCGKRGGEDRTIECLSGSGVAGEEKRERRKSERWCGG
jgi:hypothetical protein